MKHKLLALAISSIMIFGADSVSAQNNNVLIEANAGTWCQWCPCGDSALHQISNNSSNAMILVYHWGSQDPFSNFNGNSIWGMLGLNSIPAVVIGRRTGALNCNYGNCFSNWSNQVTIQSAYQPGVSIDIIKTYNPATRELYVIANALALRVIDTVCFINFVITENGIIFPQAGNSLCPGSTTWVHDWVTRNIVNSALGEQLNSGTWQQGITLTKSWTTTLPSNWVDANCFVNIFVYKQSNSLNTNSHVLQTLKQSIKRLVGIEEVTEIPSEYSLSQNYPNPFNPSTNIKFSIPKEGNVSLKIYDLTGSVVQTYVDGNMKAGTYNAEVDGSNLSSGVYLYTLKAGDFKETKKMVLIK